jgi:hypothetical protein
MNTYESKRIPSLLHTPNKFNRNTLNNIGNEAWVRSAYIAHSLVYVAHEIQVVIPKIQFPLFPVQRTF